MKFRRRWVHMNDGFWGEGHWVNGNWWDIFRGRDEEIFDQTNHAAWEPREGCPFRHQQTVDGLLVWPEGGNS